MDTITKNRKFLKSALFEARTNSNFNYNGIIRSSSTYIPSFCQVFVFAECRNKAFNLI
jgi:hypothetical protein